jgi:hypothetical protein
LLLAPTAGATVQQYFSGTLLTHKNPNCWWTIAEDCSNWNYWTTNNSDYHWSFDTGTTLSGFDNGNGLWGWTIAGPQDVFPNCSQIGGGMCGQYMRGASAYWSGHDNYVIGTASN